MHDHEAATLLLAIAGALTVWTVTIIGLVNWLNTKFRSLEKNFYNELERRRDANEKKFYKLDTMVQRLELKIFGFAGPVIHGPTDEEV